MTSTGPEERALLWTKPPLCTKHPAIVTTYPAFHAVGSALQSMETQPATWPALCPIRPITPCPLPRTGVLPYRRMMIQLLPGSRVLLLICLKTLPVLQPEARPHSHIATHLTLHSGAHLILSIPVPTREKITGSSLPGPRSVYEPTTYEYLSIG